jgi:hypothetical protein
MTFSNNMINIYEINQNITIRPPYYNESISYDYLINSNTTTRFEYNLIVLFSILNYYSFIENNNNKVIYLIILCFNMIFKLNNI